MDGLNKAFMHDPAAFLKKKVLFTAPKLGQTPPTGDYWFDLFQDKDKKDGSLIMESLVRLQLLRDRDTTPGSTDKTPGCHTNEIHAHWLPWKPGTTTRIELNSKEAQFFFTAMLDGCRITITGNTVLHIAGDTKFNDKGDPTSSSKYDDAAGKAAGTQWRTAQEAKELGDRAAGARRYSSTVPMKEGGYADAEGGFVVGYFKNGLWSFIGQAWDEDEAGAVKVAKLTELVGGDFTMPSSK